MKLVAVALAVGCGSSDTSSADRAHYLEALVSSADESVLHCTAIHDPGLRANCLIFAAQERSAAGELKSAARICEAIGSGMWRDECTFLSADAAKMTGFTATAWCSAAGEYADECAHHTTLRAFEQWALAQPAPDLGQELAFRAELEAKVSTLPPYGPIAPDKLVAAGMWPVMARRWQAEPISQQSCGALTRTECVLALSWAIRRTMSAAGDSACGPGGLRRLRAELDWRPNANPMVQQANRANCKLGW